MGIYRFEDRVPHTGEGTFVFDTAAVVGDVSLGCDVYVGPGAVVRGDYGTIIVGDRTSIEENVVIHARPGERTIIGNDVTLGHGCVIHNCTIEDLAVIGMGSVVSDYAVVGKWGVVAEGAVVRAKSVVEPGTVVAGVPARPVKKVDDEFMSTWTGFKAIYPDLARRYPGSLERIDRH
ncbi:MAG: gamma carbonic anhydrase family protein [Candidatus Thermoplasmatota archaeon]|nr:gamma carbonic anhydrase family protein [Candidatus Thermoplasmatota archaeon]